MNLSKETTSATIYNIARLTTDIKINKIQHINVPKYAALSTAT